MRLHVSINPRTPANPLQLNKLLQVILNPRRPTPETQNSSLLTLVIRAPSSLEGLEAKAIRQVVLSRPRIFKALWSGSLCGFCVFCAASRPFLIWGSGSSHVVVGGCGSGGGGCFRGIAINATRCKIPRPELDNKPGINCSQCFRV